MLGASRVEAAFEGEEGAVEVGPQVEVSEELVAEAILLAGALEEGEAAGQEADSTVTEAPGETTEVEEAAAAPVQAALGVETSTGGVIRTTETTWGVEAVAEAEGLRIGTALGHPTLECQDINHKTLI